MPIARVGPPPIGYSIFLFFFELAYCVYNNRLPAQARPEEVPIIVTLWATLPPSGIVVSVLVVGLPSDLSGPLAPLLAVVVTVTVVVAPWLSASTPRKRASPAFGRTLLRPVVG